MPLGSHSPNSERFTPRYPVLYHAVHSRPRYSFSARVPSPKTLDLQSTHADAPGWGGGGVGVMVRLANAFKRREEKDESLLRAQLHG